MHIHIYIYIHNIQRQIVNCRTLEPIEAQGPRNSHEVEDIPGLGPVNDPTGSLNTEKKNMSKTNVI